MRMQISYTVAVGKAELRYLYVYPSEQNCYFCIYEWASIGSWPTGSRCGEILNYL
jgi:hypothetical protein